MAEVVRACNGMENQVYSYLEEERCRLRAEALVDICSVKAEAAIRDQ
jgi:hypothetical protein